PPRDLLPLPVPAPGFLVPVPVRAADLGSVARARPVVDPVPRRVPGHRADAGPAGRDPDLVVLPGRAGGRALALAPQRGLGRSTALAVAGRGAVGGRGRGRGGPAGSFFRPPCLPG